MQIGFWRALVTFGLAILLILWLSPAMAMTRKKGPSGSA